MQITVLTSDKELFTGAVTSVIVPGTDGQFQILKNHAAIVSSLEKGEIEMVTASGEHRYYDEESSTIKIVEEPGKTISFSIEGGFIEMLNNEISLLVRGLKEE